MGNMTVHFSSGSDEWETPDDLFDLLSDEFAFTLDACASDENHKVDRYYTKQDDALSRAWTGVVWMNPPYGREIGKWAEHAYKCSVTDRAIVVCLVPARTDTVWWHTWVAKALEVRLLKGRIKFKRDGDKVSSAPFPSAIVVFCGDLAGTARYTLWDWQKDE